jgi:two-component system, chemotaxis family, chemotaxis protein CheY
MLKCLIVEDDFASRKLLQNYLSDFALCDIAVNGYECIEAFQDSLEQGQPYDLICLDIMMPGMDGQDALKAIRQIESEHNIGGLDGIKIIMTTALGDSQNILGAFRGGCEAYVVKPINKNKLLNQIRKLGLSIQKAGVCDKDSI